MNVKIDTKEKFTVITPQISELTANMTVELSNLLLPYLVINLSYHFSENNIV